MSGCGVGGVALNPRPYRRGRLAWPGAGCRSARRPAALAVFRDLIRSHADPRPGPRMRSAARSRRESEDAMTESSADHAHARRAILNGASLVVGSVHVSRLTPPA